MVLFMDQRTDLSRHLAASARDLLVYAATERGIAETRVGELDALIHDALAREHRRAAFNLRDARCYRLGAAFEPVDGLELDPVAMAGWLASGHAGLAALVGIALKHPEGNLVDHLRVLFRSDLGQPIRAIGVWTRWHYLKSLYDAEVTQFLSSPAYHRKAWRSKSPTAHQTYIIAEISLDLEIETPRFSRRGEAFEWILAKAGNPRFQNEPARPDLAALLELVA
jgi:hypothetical protein